MNGEQIATAFALIAAVLSTQQPSQDQIDAAGAAAISVATQVITDLNSIAQSLQSIAGDVTKARAAIETIDV